jgi:RNA polymerase sigma-70 factor (ECF subfamily)
MAESNTRDLTDCPHRVAEDFFRREGARLVATLTAHLGTHRLQLAEDAVQEALVRALQVWPYRGIPDNPAAWLTRTAKNCALDVLRREQRWTEKVEAIALTAEPPPSPHEASDAHGPGDEMLRLLFVCFHPQLSAEAQLALALRTVCGLSAAEIAAAFLVSEAAISKRLVRARQRIRELELPFAMPDDSELPARLDGVLRALYLLFNEGYKASSGPSLVRADLCAEAVRLASLLCAHPATTAPRTHALHALLCLTAARLPARTDAAGRLLRLHEQDRSSWDQSLLVRGLASLAQSATGEALSSWHLEAGIAAAHSVAENDATTDWPRILGLYDQLLLLQPSPVAAMNRAVAVGRVQGPAAGLAALAAIPNRHALDHYHLYHVVHASLAADCGDTPQAVRSLRIAHSLAPLAAEREVIERRLQQLSDPVRSIQPDTGAHTAME